MKRIKQRIPLLPALLLALIVSITACGGFETAGSQTTSSQEPAQEVAAGSSKATSGAASGAETDAANKSTQAAEGGSVGAGTEENVSGNPAASQTEPGMIYALEDEIADAKKVKLNLPANAEVLTDFAASMERMRDEGLDFLGYGMTRQASYCFSFVGGSVSAVRLAAEEILGNEPTGFGDWDTVGAVSFATPVPLLCEAVAADFKGDTERAEECKNRAELNPNKIAEYMVFAALADMDQKTLENLAAALIEFENHIYWFYPADPVPRPRNGMEWSPEFHLVLAAAFEELDQTKLATDAYLDALAQDPFNPNLFAMCAKAMYQAGDIGLMRTYIDEGLLMDSEHALLNALAALLWYAADDAELAKEYLAVAKAANSSDDEVQNICNAVEAAMEGGE